MGVAIIYLPALLIAADPAYTDIALGQIKAVISLWNRGSRRKEQANPIGEVCHIPMHCHQAERILAKRRNLDGLFHRVEFCAVHPLIPLLPETAVHAVVVGIARSDEAQGWEMFSVYVCDFNGHGVFSSVE